MKALPYLVWIVLGACLGLIVGQIFGPEHRPASPALKEAPALQPSKATPKKTSATLFAALPSIPSIGIEDAVLQLHEAPSTTSPERQRAELLRFFLDRAADPSKAAEVVQQLQDSATAANNHVRIISEVFKQWAAKDPQAAMDALATLKTRQLVMQSMRGALKVWVLADPVAALDYVKTATIDAVAFDGPAIALNALAEVDPQRAFEAARDFDDPDLERSLHRRLIAKKAETNIEQAWAEIEQLEDAELQSALRDSAIRGLAEKDRTAALAYVDKLTEPHNRKSHIRRIIGQWPLANAEEATEAFLNYPAEALVDGPAFDFGQMMNLVDSQKALDFSNSLNGELRDNYLLGVLTEQAIKRPAETAEIVTDYIEGDRHLARIYEHLGSSWAGIDEHSAAQWLAELPESAARDKAVSSFSRKLFSLDPERAVQWAVTITGEQERTKRVSNLLDQWQAKDPSAADAWLKQNGYGQE